MDGRIRRGEVLALVDVRSPDEFASGHIEGAVNIPLDELPVGLASLAHAPTVVTICTSGGGRSEKAAQLLRQHGIVSVRSLCGGVREWQAQRMPMVAARG
ncbi:MAG: rhodanese-like domain-containing protein [Acidobacteriota bacterium]